MVSARVKCVHSIKPNDLMHQLLVNSSPSSFYFALISFYLVIHLLSPPGWDLMKGKGCIHFYRLRMLLTKAYIDFK